MNLLTLSLLRAYVAGVLEEAKSEKISLLTFAVSVVAFLANGFT